MLSVTSWKKPNIFFYTQTCVNAFYPVFPAYILHLLISVWDPRNLSMCVLHITGSYAWGRVTDASRSLRQKWENKMCVNERESVWLNQLNDSAWLQRSSTSFIHAFNRKNRTGTGSWKSLHLKTFKTTSKIFIKCKSCRQKCSCLTRTASDYIELIHVTGCWSSTTTQFEIKMLRV